MVASRAPARSTRDVINLAGKDRCTEHVCKVVALDRLHPEARHIGLASPALQRPVLIEIDDEHLLTPLGQARPDSRAACRLSDAALGRRK